MKFNLESCTSSNFLNFSLPKPSLKTSIVIATYNRCPFKNFNNNPLYWCLSSLLSQKNASIEEIIVVDDASSDYTTENLEKIKKISEIPILVVKNEKRVGSPKSRNLGISLSKNNYIFFGDDDCLFSPFSLFGAQYAFQLTRKTDPKIKAIHLPFYFRELKPRKTIKISEMGQVDFCSGTYSTKLKFFPEEYINAPEFLDSSIGLLKPFKIKHLTGIFLAEKDSLASIGGFPEYFSWPNAFTEELEVGERMIEKGHSLYFLPDPKCFAIHFKFGYFSRDYQDYNSGEERKRFFSDINLAFKNKLSNLSAIKTGNRVDRNNWAFSKIISYYVFFSKRSLDCGEKWMEGLRKSFVVENDDSFYSSSQDKIPYRERREEIWNLAKRKGKALLEKIA